MCSGLLSAKVEVEDQVEEVIRLRAERRLIAEKCGVAEGRLDAGTLKLQQVTRS